MYSFKDQRGIAFLLVLLALVIISASFMAIFAGLRTQSNVSMMVGGSGNGLTMAEDGLVRGRAILTKGTAIGSGFNYQNNGWNIVVTYTVGTPGTLQSTASKGRYSRAVAVDVTLIPVENTNLNKALDNAIFTQGSMNFVNGTIDLNGKDIFTNGSISIATNMRVECDSTGSLSSAGTIDSRGTVTNGELLPNQPPIAFPELDFSELKDAANVIHATPSNLSDLIQSNQSTGGIIVCEVDTDKIEISQNVTVTSGKKLTIVFVKKSTYTNDFGVHFVGNNYNGDINLLADGGTFHFNNTNFNSSGVIYTNRYVEQTDGVKINNVDFKVGGIVSKDQIKLTNLAFAIETSNYANRWNFLQDFWKPTGTKPNYTNWREL